MKKDPETLTRLIRQVPDFPKPGILFYDISTVLRDAHGFETAIDLLSAELTNLDFDLIAGVDSRGFVFGAALADRHRKGFVLVRKPGKLPGITRKIEYALEYGRAELELCEGAIEAGQRIVVVDDLLATGGTAQAACKLLENEGGKVLMALFLIELHELKGRDRMGDVRCKSVLHL